MAPFALANIITVEIIRVVVTLCVVGILLFRTLARFPIATPEII